LAAAYPGDGTAVTTQGGALGSFGQRMQREREMRGITLEEIAESTKISSRALRALEEEKFDKLPGGIFNKGFVRAYARYLGIDEEQAVADFVAVAGEPQQPLPDPVEPRRSEGIADRADSHPQWLALALLLLLVAGLIVAGWKLGPVAARQIAGIISRRSPAKPQPSPAPRPASPPPSIPASAEDHPPSPPAAPERKPVAKAVTGAASARESALGQAQDETPAPAPAQEFVVQIRATKDAWVQIVADGTLITEGMLIPPAEKRIHAQKEVVIKTGNAAGVEVSFNGQLLPSLGDENQVATVTFNAGGVQR
jgi:cytoskeleton protein RodZ